MVRVTSVGSDGALAVLDDDLFDLLGLDTCRRCVGEGHIASFLQLGVAGEESFQMSV